MIDVPALVLRDPYTAIIEAAKAGKGLTLSASEVSELARNGTIAGEAAFNTRRLQAPE